MVTVTPVEETAVILEWIQSAMNEAGYKWTHDKWQSMKHKEM